ncbi:hypothetical protein SLEP1_g16363 [Rubroshorea leprosula]|uniref:DNA-directed RNA polymerase III subunit n=1 Tax=Rubroshorea leprosula TaxID=152421 RepID=A0AAV5J140_9ROSI|nr:hypothetical protein SLEP1_g16363 [Rubroshorea leprosula]
MAFRGRGRGRGYGGGRGFFGHIKQEPVILFPEKELPDIKGVPEEKTLIIANAKLQNYWKSSPYNLEETASKKNESMDIERFSDCGKPKTLSRRNNLDQFLQLRSDNFPKELLRDSRRVPRNPKRVRWNPDSDFQKLNVLEDLEKKFEDKEKDGGDKRGGEDEDEEDEEGEKTDEEFSDDGDYNQNRDFDDDEDDYNAEDGNDDEPVY